MRYIFGQRGRERPAGPVSVLMGRDKVGDLIWVVVFGADYISCVQLSLSSAIKVGLYCAISIQKGFGAEKLSVLLVVVFLCII